MRTTVWAATLLVLGSLSVARAWDSWFAVLVLAVVAVVPLLLLRGVIALGVSRWAAASVLALLLVLVAYLLGAEAGTSLGATVSDALPRLLGEPLPLALRADLLATPVLAVGVTSLLTGLRLHSRTRVTPVVAGFLLYGGGALLTSGDGDPLGLLAAVLLAASLAGWALLDDHPEPTRRRTAVLAPLAGAGVALTVLAAAVPASNAFDPRDLVDAPVVTVEVSNPLPQLGAWAANPRLELLRVRGPEAPLRLVVLTRYDGVQWSSPTRFSRVGVADPGGLPAGRRQAQLVQRLDLLNLVGPWLPAGGRARDISLDDVLVDPETGTLYLDDDHDRTGYEVTARIDAPRRDALVGATVPTGPDVAPYLEVPDLPYSLAEYAQAATRGAASPYDRALAIEAAVRGGRRFTTKAISGSAYWRIEGFLLGEKGTPGARAGSSEQFATAFAVLARQSGLPTRLVVGFRPGEEAADGSRIVRGEDAMAWPEVYFDDLGWVPFSPLPDDDTFAHEDRDPGPPETDAPTPTPTAPTATGTVAPHDQSGAGDDGGASASSDDSGQGIPWLFLGGALVAVPLLALWALRRLRTLRHRRAGARGAWAEVLDYLALVGAPATARESATDVSRRAEKLLAAPVGDVAAGAERAAYGPPGDPADRWPTELADVRRAARRSLPAWRRWWWWLDPRPLRRPRRG